MIEELLNNNLTEFYLTTGRTLAQYNNSSQTNKSKKLHKRYSEDILLVSESDAHLFTTKRVVLKTKNGQTTPLSVKISDKIKPKTLFTTFHHAKSNINALFGDKRDEVILAGAFKSIKVEVIPQNE
jgi:formate dehydrogenase major subunit